MKEVFLLGDMNALFYKERGENVLNKNCIRLKDIYSEFELMIKGTFFAHKQNHLKQVYVITKQKSEIGGCPFFFFFTMTMEVTSSYMRIVLAS